MNENPWKTLSTSRIYQNPWFAVREDQVLRPDGQPGTYSVVSAARIATGILPLWPDARYAGGQSRYAIRSIWEIRRGGGLEASRTLAEGVLGNGSRHHRGVLCAYSKSNSLSTKSATWSSPTPDRGRRNWTRWGLACAGTFARW